MIKVTLNLSVTIFLLLSICLCFLTQEQDLDLWPVWRDSSGCLTVLLPRHGCGTQDVSSKVSAAPHATALTCKYTLIHFTHFCLLVPPTGLAGGFVLSPTVFSSLFMMRSENLSSAGILEVNIVFCFLITIDTFSRKRLDLWMFTLH